MEAATTPPGAKPMIDQETGEEIGKWWPEGEGKPEASPEALALARIDDQDIDRIEIKFSGSIRLDRSDPADVALFRRMKLGKEVDLRIVGTAAGKDHKISYDEDGYPGETTAVAKLKLTSIFRPLSDEPGAPEARTGSDQTELTAVE